MLRCINLVALLLLAAPVHAEISGPIRVIDGDTLDVSGTRIRLHGIDAPEQDQTCTTEQNVAFDCGAWVTRQVTALYADRIASCAAVETDKYGRTVATCAVDGQDIGERLVDDGLAYAYRKYSMAYDLNEKGAAIADRGLWAMNATRPSWHRQTKAVGRIPVNAECKIKGNISSKGKRIYHVPGQVDYERTGIRTNKGERWFCNETEAQAAGWRRAYR